MLKNVICMTFKTKKETRTTYYKIKLPDLVDKKPDLVFVSNKRNFPTAITFFIDVKQYNDLKSMGYDRSVNIMAPITVVNYDIKKKQFVETKTEFAKNLKKKLVLHHRARPAFTVSVQFTKLVRLQIKHNENPNEILTYYIIDFDSLFGTMDGITVMTFDPFQDLRDYYPKLSDDNVAIFDQWSTLAEENEQKLIEWIKENTNFKLDTVYIDFETGSIVEPTYKTLLKFKINDIARIDQDHIDLETMRLA